MTHFNDPGLPDDILLTGFRKTGDHGAFEALMLRHIDSIRRFLSTHLSLTDDVAEAEQETLIRLFGSLRSFDARSSLVTFIYRICQRVAADQIRHRQRDWRKMRRFIMLRETEANDGKDGPLGEIAREETRAEILAALNTLREPDRSILYLRDAEDVSVSELARGFGLPEGTIKSRLSRSREKLRPILGCLVHEGGANHER